MSADTVIGCFTARAWARIIAILQILINLGMGAYVMWVLADGLSIEDEHLRLKAGALSMSVFGLISCALGISMGIILLVGTRKGHKLLLTIWMILAVAQFIWAIIDAGFGNNGGFVARIAYFCVNIFLYIFGIRVVYSLTSNSNLRYPTKI